MRSVPHRRQSAIMALLIVGLFAGGCATPGQTGIAAGVTAGAATALIVSAAGGNDTVAAIAGAGTALVVGGIAYTVQRRYEASESQRREAEARAIELDKRIAPAPAAEAPKAIAVKVTPINGEGRSDQYVLVDRASGKAANDVIVFNSPVKSGQVASVKSGVGEQGMVYFE